MYHCVIALLLNYNVQTCMRWWCLCFVVQDVCFPKTEKRSGSWFSYSINKIVEHSYQKGESESQQACLSFLSLSFLLAMYVRSTFYLLPHPSMPSHTRCCPHSHSLTPWCSLSMCTILSSTSTKDKAHFSFITFALPPKPKERTKPTTN